MLPFTLTLNYFSLFRVSLHANTKPALEKINDLILTITSPVSSDLLAIVSRMNFADLNRALYRCDQEERDSTADKFGVYDIPGYGPLVYAGLQGEENFKMLSFKVTLNWYVII